MLDKRSFSDSRQVFNAPTHGVSIGAWAVDDGDVALDYSSAPVTREPVFAPAIVIYSTNLILVSRVDCRQCRIQGFAI